MEHYVTLFDSLFLPQGLALHASMERHAGNFTLWILCVDDTAYEVLNRLALASTRLLQLDKVETSELKQVREERSRGEYCWTLTPFAPRFVFESDPEVERVTYLDADMWLRKSPTPIFRELDTSGKSVLITDHGYAPEYDQTATSGQFCVQFMTFHRERGEGVRKWWEERCIEWCYARSEDGKFGDQKYLDDWPERFADEVHIVQHHEWMLAPWNSIRFPYGGAIWHHFHGLKIVDEHRFKLSNYSIPNATIQSVYRPYLQDLRTAYVLIRKAGMEPRCQNKWVKAGKLNKIYHAIIGLIHHRWRYSTLGYIYTDKIDN